MVTAEVKLWDERMGAVTWITELNCASFQFDTQFLRKNRDVSPIHLPISDAQRVNTTFMFSGLAFDTFQGLPGLLADSLPDSFGHRLLDVWLAQKGLTPQHVNPVERLCYMGTRSMGALSFHPIKNHTFEQSNVLALNELVEITQKIMADKAQFAIPLGQTDKEKAQALLNVLSVSTSAGGARPKAIIAMNASGEIRSGLIVAPEGFDYWLLKFDGVTEGELGKPTEYGKREYAYYLMAKDCGIEMSECRLLEENGRHHFMTTRFDRVNHEKIHMQTLCGLQHYDYRQAGAYSYEQAFATMRQLNLKAHEAEQLFRRMVFNVMAKNQDDHTKNISFLMDKKGTWHLSPAYDVTYAHNPLGQWTNQHQMRVNGKRENISVEDFSQVARSINLKHDNAIIEQISDVIHAWPRYAKAVDLKSPHTLAPTV
ncbi:MAG TPA: toxin HipA [Methylococcaceae bacterium]|nr:toxin HipA [Methylococcaceae bacterium]